MIPTHFIMRVYMLAASQYAVLYSDGGEFAGAHADKSSALSINVSRVDVDAASLALRAP